MKHFGAHPLICSACEQKEAENYLADIKRLSGVLILAFSKKPHISIIISVPSEISLLYSYYHEENIITWRHSEWSVSFYIL